MLLLPESLLPERRAAAAGALASLAESLAADLEPLLQGGIYMPEAKALLSRAGGRCETDGTPLEFDPFSPHAHRCPACGRVYGGEWHHRWWVYSYQLWLAERGVHAALLYLLRGEARHAALARDIAHRYADAYAHYPNRDNVLGPTRLFFSTYLESIWLLQLCAAADLMNAGGDRATADAVRERIVAPSAALIAQYDEGMSNRQVWNNAALMAAALLLGDRMRAERIVRGPSGVEAHLRYGLLADGTWYEGENYHLFAHRGLWYCMVMAEVAGIGMAPDLVARFQEGFATPFLTALPDFTLPSRKDSQHAVSLQQSRFAELCELGLARGQDARLAGALHRMYASDAPVRDTGRSRSTADVEHNVAPARLTRADLGWRSLLHAPAELRQLEPVAPRSELLDAQGIAVFRRDRGETYVALDYGQSGGGHGHPDRLNVLFAHGSARWLDDLGTGSYVDRSLHWYRSTLAHNAPLVDGRSQLRVDGRLLAWDERGEIGWVLAEVDHLAPGVHVERAQVVGSDYFVDELRWTATASSRVELPLHFDGAFSSPGAMLAAAEHLDGGDALEDGFAFVEEVRSAALAAAAVVELVGGEHHGHRARAWASADSASTWFRASAPGQPAGVKHPFFVVRCEGTRGVIRCVWSWSPRVTAVRFDGDRVEVSLGTERHVHHRVKDCWRVDLSVAGVESVIELAGWRPSGDASPEAPIPAAVPHRAPTLIPHGTTATFALGEPHYRRSEETWAEAGCPTAIVSVSATGDELTVDVRVSAAALMFASPGAVNPYDNEHPDVNGHGVQLYVTTPFDAGAWMIVPEPGLATARVRPLVGWGSLEFRRASARPSSSGYQLRVEIALPNRGEMDQYPVALDVLINEMPTGRERRRGQLVLSGAFGEFVYLRGDRHDPARLVSMVLAR
ncbi:MAG TPA: heparinase II/III family protein [Gemmatimonadaceae bacterium]|nr:heparinase II/III family protein [Gemmatimonadaceae bacterium]